MDKRISALIMLVILMVAVIIIAVPYTVLTNISKEYQSGFFSLLSILFIFGMTIMLLIYAFIKKEAIGA